MDRVNAPQQGVEDLLHTSRNNCQCPPKPWSHNQLLLMSVDNRHSCREWIVLMRHNKLPRFLQERLHFEFVLEGRPHTTRNRCRRSPIPSSHNLPLPPGLLVV